MVRDTAAATLGRLLPQRASVLTADANGEFTVVAKTGLACQLAHLRAQPGVGAPERAEQIANRSLYFDPAYALPSERVRFRIDGDEWAAVAGTRTDQRGFRGELVYRQIDVVRVVA